MQTHNTVIQNDVTPVSAESIEEMLADITFDDIIEDIQTEDVIDAEALEAAEAAIVIEEAVLEDQMRDDTASEYNLAEGEGEGEKPAPKTRKAATSKAPRIPRDLAALDTGNFILTEEMAEAIDAIEDAADRDALAAQMKADVIARKPTQKKIADKFENALLNLAAGKLPSTYTVQAVKLLTEKKTVTMSELVAFFDASYDLGTARSQAGQMFVLFPALRIAERSGSSMTINQSSLILSSIMSLCS